MLPISAPSPPLPGISPSSAAPRPRPRGITGQSIVWLLLGRAARFLRTQNLLPIAVPSQPGGVSGRIASAGHADHVAKPPELAKPVATVPRYPAAYRQTIEGGRVA